MRTCKLKFLQDEYWTGGYVDGGNVMPVSPSATCRFEMLKNMSLNQLNPIFVSTKGRYIWCDDYYNIAFRNGEIDIDYPDNAELVVGESGRNAYDAYMAACRKHFEYDGRLPHAKAFTSPQYNTWIALMYNQTQQGILQYARSAAKLPGFDGAVLMIDCGWQKDYGEWEFNGVFEDPKAMVKELHELGFLVMLWIVPFVSPDSSAFRTLRAADALVKTKEDKPFLAEWWDGFSAVLDMSNSRAEEWLQNQLDSLQQKYGIDGFKFDAGDPKWYMPDNQTAGNVSENRQSELWAKFALQYPLNELRACCKAGGTALIQRIADRHHRWDSEYGLSGLISKCLSQSMSGYAYLSPDMVGGGLFSDFMGKAPGEIDKELFIRYCQACALMPMMQFSFDYWRVMDEETVKICNDYANLHRQMGNYIFEYAQKTAETGIPIIRTMAFSFDGLYDVSDQFMLGDDYLVAPVLQKGAVTKSVRLPEGKWKYAPTGEVFAGGIAVTVPAPLTVLPYFIKQ